MNEQDRVIIFDDGHTDGDNNDNVYIVERDQNGRLQNLPEEETPAEPMSHPLNDGNAE